MSRRGLHSLLLVPILVLVGDHSPADKTPPTVSLILSKASAKRQEQEVVFRCEAILHNAIGRALTVRSTFSSAFDGLELVVTDNAGKVLAQQRYTAHQSPFTPDGRNFEVKKGTTVGQLVFPVRDLAGNVKTVKVRIVGTLPGSGYDRILSTETIKLDIKG